MLFGLILNAKYDLGLFQDPYKYCDLQRAKMKFSQKNFELRSHGLSIVSFTQK
jgi:beta-glucosidase